MGILSQNVVRCNIELLGILVLVALARTRLLKVS
ncbi:hypothetical protein LINPERHAP2_LOCUS11757 [Linum perenne]